MHKLIELLSVILILLTVVAILSDMKNEKVAAFDLYIKESKHCQLLMRNRLRTRV